MSRRTISCAIALSLTSMGCAAVTDATHATSYWTHQAIQDSRERHRNCKLAEAAWAEVRSGNPGSAASEDYADGFKDGFADHLFRATTTPPPLPPKRYRELRYQTPAGFRAGAEWLAGFRHGIDAARASGLRELVTGPSSLGAEPAAGGSRALRVPGSLDVSRSVGRPGPEGQGMLPWNSVCARMAA